MTCLKSTSCAVLHNVYVGLWVLLSQLYWLAGPDFKHRREQRSRQAAIARCRKKMKNDSDVLIHAEAETLEAEQASADAAFAAARAHYLELVRQRIGLS